MSNGTTTCNDGGGPARRVPESAVRAAGIMGPWLDVSTSAADDGAIASGESSAELLPIL